ncbi:hypothetical protein [Terrimonas pollutisoli]|uniref:hypothetical protein n=1 Tax=Terrimonas pollutisoli TaxID=3034147 RepID=UPI0023EAC288|nr:hypothetical protein [Terrimonas sp. H1YJ31]
MEKLKFIISLFLFFSSGTIAIKAQMITGVWTGKINRQKVEVKIVQKGGSLTGTTYYYESPNNYRRYSIKGYFDPGTNEAVWWDDQLIEENGRGSSGGKTPLLSRADFNCPGYGRMMLGGKASKVDNENERAGEVNLDKTDWSNFSDEWDFVLENFTVGANDPEIIDSVDLIATAKKTIEDQPVKPFREEESVISIPEPTPTQIEFPKPESTITVMPVEPIKPSGIEQKYTARKKVFATEIPVSGDSVELHFYDNAQIDGDSISLFLNDKLIFEHIRLTDKAYSIKLAVTELNSSNELIMVAENLGSIPPNTSYMVANVGDKRYEARLESTEGSSALIRLVKPTDER